MMMLPESYHSNTDALDISQIRIYDPSIKSDVTFLCAPEIT